MRLERSSVFPLGLVLGLAIGAALGNGSLGALLGMVAGLLLSSAAGSRNSGNGARPRKFPSAEPGAAADGGA